MKANLRKGHLMGQAMFIIMERNKKQNGLKVLIQGYYHDFF